jgi:hypothetical protein
VSVVLTDNGPSTPPNDNTSDAQTFTITVVGTLQVAAVMPTDSGFVARFNRPLTASDLNLYDQGGMFGPADVALIMGSATGNVRGSLLVNAAGDEVTFVKTGGPLANDTYTVTLRSAANGFHDGANLLDGNGDGTSGDAYVSTFTRNIPSAAVTVSIPDFARGHGQVVDVWNFAARATYEGIPVLLSSGLGVSGVEFTIHYDPALLTIDTVKLGLGVAAGASLSYSIPSPGTIAVSINSNSSLATTAGQLALVSLMHGSESPLVPIEAPYGATHMLEITNLAVFDNTPLMSELPSIASGGIHVAAYAGELSGNQAYNSPDTSFAQQFIVNQSTFGLANYPLTDPLILADINNNGLVQGNDVAQIQRMSGGRASPYLPALPAESPSAYTAGASSANPQAFAAPSNADFWLAWDALAGENDEEEGEFWW